LTAGHNVHGAPKKSVRITLPGFPHVNYSKLTQGKLFTVECEVLSCQYSKGNATKDIAILHAGSSLAADCLELSSELPPLDAVVCVVGYPGHIKPEWMETQKGITDVDESIGVAAKLLPERTLTATRGTVASSGPLITYSLSTVPGMSGSCVIYKGKVVGLFFHQLSLIPGVHVGQASKEGSLPAAVSFTGPDVLSFFQNKKFADLIKIPKPPP